MSLIDNNNEIKTVIKSKIYFNDSIYSIDVFINFTNQFVYSLYFYFCVKYIFGLYEYTVFHFLLSKVFLKK